jgi:uncharacterized protein DUF3883
MSISDLTSPAAVRAALKEYDRLGRDEILRIYGYKEAREYMLRSDERDYDSKAIAGIAHKYQFPAEGPLKPSSFSGGISKGAAARKLSSLGFKIVGLTQVKQDWTQTECLKTVKRYFETLVRHQRGEEINKAAAYRELANELGRPMKAVEYKFQNIDAILSEDDLPRLGKSVAMNYQQLLRSVVEDYMQENKDLFDIAPAHAPTPKRFADVLVDPPSGRALPKRNIPGIAKPGVLGGSHEENKKLGRLGEEWVVSLETQKLLAAGRPDLAQKIMRIAAEMGDGYGYDILSFTEDGDEILIEVKTTNGGIRRSFPVTSNELAVARERGKQFNLYRVFNFSESPRFYRLTGPLETSLDLTPAVYQARIS